MMRQLGRWHVWLGWLVGVPLLLWTASGLWMTARPIEEVRGEHLRRKPVPIALDRPLVLPTLPTDHGAPIMLRLEQQRRGPVWVAIFAGGHEMRWTARDGRWLPRVDEAEARAIARRWYLPDVEIVGARHTSADHPPLDLRRRRPAWGITFADGTNVYVDADTGSLLAVRSAQWRWYDLMWGLHIMDLREREASSHPMLIGAAALSLLAVILGIALLFRRRGRHMSAG